MQRGGGEFVVLSHLSAEVHLADTVLLTAVCPGTVNKSF